MAVEPGPAQAEGAEYLDQARGLPVRADGDEVRDLASQPSAPPADLSVADDGAAQSFPQEDIREVIQAACAAALALGPRGPVHVIVDDDRAPDLRRQNLGRIQFPEQERGVGEMDQPAAAALDRIGGAHDGEPRGLSRLTLDLRGGAQQRRGDLHGPGQADGLPGTRHRVPEGVHGLGRHPVRGDAGHERRADAPGPGRSTSRPGRGRGRRGSVRRCRAAARPRSAGARSRRPSASTAPSAWPDQPWSAGGPASAPGVRAHRSANGAAPARASREARLKTWPGSQVPL